MLRDYINKEFKMFPNAPEIKRSINYDQFKFINWNREVNKPNLIKLIEENRKKFQLHKFPILVTKEYKVVDGQHRYMASKELGSPIYYIVADDMDESIESVQSVNKAGKRHSRADKLEMISGGRMSYTNMTMPEWCGPRITMSRLDYDKLNLECAFWSDQYTAVVRKMENIVDACKDYGYVEIEWGSKKYKFTMEELR